MSKIKDPELNSIIEGFKIFGSETNGLINPNDLKEIMETMNMAEKNPFLYNIIENFCLDPQIQEKGGIEAEDFIGKLEEELNDISSLEGLNKLFSVFFNPITNTIPITTFPQIAQNIGEEENEEKLKKLILKSGVGDRELNINEFNEIINTDNEFSNKNNQNFVYRKKPSKKNNILNNKINNSNSDLNNNIYDSIDSLEKVEKDSEMYNYINKKQVIIYNKNNIKEEIKQENKILNYNNNNNNNDNELNDSIEDNKYKSINFNNDNENDNYNDNENDNYNDIVNDNENDNDNDNGNDNDMDNDVNKFDNYNNNNDNFNNINDFGNINSFDNTNNKDNNNKNDINSKNNYYSSRNQEEQKDLEKINNMRVDKRIKYEEFRFSKKKDDIDIDINIDNDKDDSEVKEMEMSYKIRHTKGRIEQDDINENKIKEIKNENNKNNDERNDLKSSKRYHRRYRDSKPNNHDKKEENLISTTNGTIGYSRYRKKK